ncbi:MAG: hypothetical protein CMF23_00245 [Ignavibacteriae bacterium]|nr:hypothetical protein [Ignavibacteriota bacterium]
MSKHFNRPEQKPIRRKLRREQTYTEKVVWMQVRNRRLMGIKFKRQYSVDQYIIDFYAPDIKVALEIDGDIHELPEVKENDEIRQKHIEQFGIQFIRLTNEEILGNPNKAFTKLEKKLKEIISQ